MQLWRIDATFDGDDDELAGQITLFVIAGSAEHELAWLRDAGWDADGYVEEAELPHGDREELLGHVWPTLPTERLLELARAPKTDARRQLTQILERRKEAVL